ncbi:MAG: DUF3883 domain-containing protein [Gammaproteobacteria bacterium]|nr:DUF3883 domain-containing protein [Gammaproteobacteria bacterium]
MSLVLFNIGWMKHYRGEGPIFNGGRYVQENEIGGEVRNFEPANGRCYGYVRTQSGGRIKMKRLGARAKADYADNVTVVFTATSPEGGARVVGWYRNARVWRERRRRAHYDIHFVAEVPQEDCRLLEPHDRVFSVPRTGPEGAFVMGRSNVRYTDEPEAKPFVRRLRQYMEDPDAWPPRTPGGAPRQSDPALRAKVEKAAVHHVISHWPYLGYDWRSVEKENKGWDLEFTRGACKVLVEVKGCSGPVGTVELTPGEYTAMQKHRFVYKLAIVTRALEDPRLSLISFNGSDETWRDQHEREVRLEPRTGLRVHGHQ